MKKVMYISLFWEKKYFKEKNHKNFFLDKITLFLNNFFSQYYENLSFSLYPTAPNI